MTESVTRAAGRWIAIAATAGLLSSGSCKSDGGSESSSVSPAATTPAEVAASASGVNTRLVEDLAYTIRIPAGLPRMKEREEMLQTEGTADQLSPGFKSDQPITVGINIYHSSKAQFYKRASVSEWVAHPLPPYSMFRSRTLSPPIVRTVQIAGAEEAAIVISEHEGVDQLTTGGQKALSMRLFVKPASADPGGWVLGAFAVGEADDPLLRPDGKLANALQESLKSFKLTGLVLPGSDAPDPGLPPGHPR